MPGRTEPRCPGTATDYLKCVSNKVNVIKNVRAEVHKYTDVKRKSFKRVNFYNLFDHFVLDTFFYSELKTKM